MTDSIAEFGLIGKGLSHSFSADYFNAKFQNEGISARYKMFDIPEISHILDVIEENRNLRGLNVTSPYKRDVIPYINKISDDAAKLQAVNVIKIDYDAAGNKILTGHNTDWEGFMATFRKLGIIPSQRALIMGTGGASSAVALAFEKVGLQYDLVSRNPRPGMKSYEEMNSSLQDYDILVNATPIGMFPNVDNCPPVDFNKICSRHLCYDLIYNPAESLFLRLSRKKGAKTFNGLKMLQNQAELAWKIWSEQ